MGQTRRFGWILVLAVSVMPIAMAQVDMAVNGELVPAIFDEGKTITLEPVLRESCLKSSVNFPTLATSMILPTGSNAVVKKGSISNSGVTINADAILSDELDGPIFSTIKPFVDPLWQSIKLNRIDNSNDKEVLNIQWLGGFVENDKVASLKLMATLPTFKPGSCIDQVRVFLPTIQYCTLGFSHESVNASGVVIDKNDVNTATVGDAAFFTITRSSPLPNSCSGSDNVLFIYPSAADIQASSLIWSDKISKVKLKTSGVQRAAAKWTPLCPVGTFWHAAMGHCMAR